MAQRVPIDPDLSLPDLVRQLGDDSKRLLVDEVRLARLESLESLHAARRGAMWLGVAFGVAVVALVAMTLFAAAGIGAIARGHVWVGATVTAAVELALGLWFVRRGLRDLARATYSFPETRAGLHALKGS